MMLLRHMILEAKKVTIVHYNLSSKIYCLPFLFLFKFLILSQLDWWPKKSCHVYGWKLVLTGSAKMFNTDVSLIILYVWRKRHRWNSWGWLRRWSGWRSGWWHQWGNWTKIILSYISDAIYNLSNKIDTTCMSIELEYICVLLYSYYW